MEFSEHGVRLIVLLFFNSYKFSLKISLILRLIFTFHHIFKKQTDVDVNFGRIFIC